MPLYPAAATSALHLLHCSSGHHSVVIERSFAICNFFWRYLVNSFVHLCELQASTPDSLRILVAFYNKQNTRQVSDGSWLSVIVGRLVLLTMWSADVQQKVFTRWINWRLRKIVIEQPDNLVDQLRDGTVLSTILSTVTQGVFQPVSLSLCLSVCLSVCLYVCLFSLLLKFQ